MQTGERFLIQYLISHVLVYPLLTVQRRLEAKSSFINGMLPADGKGFFGTFSSIISKEGIRSLYRGFIAYSLVVGDRADLAITWPSDCFVPIDRHIPRPAINDS